MLEYNAQIERDLIIFEISSIDPKEEVLVTTNRFLSLVEMVKYKENNRLLRNEIKNYIYELLRNKNKQDFASQIEALQSSLVMLY